MSVCACRRVFLLGLAALPAAGGVAVAAPADPHVALAEEAVALWHRHKASVWGWTQPGNSPEAAAANAAHEALMEHCLAAAETPPPCTLPGLRALAVILALSNEEAWSEGEDRIEQQRRTFVEAALSVTGAVLPAGFAGLTHYRRDGEGDTFA